MRDLFEVKGYILETNCGVLDYCGKSSFPPEALMSVLEGSHRDPAADEHIEKLSTQFISVRIYTSIIPV